MSVRPAINRERLLGDIESLAAVNRLSDGSCCRLALTDADKQGRDLVVSWLRAAKLEVHIDEIGNVFGIRAGTTTDAPIMTGSHIDTVATGGRYDGAYGVLAGLEAMRALNEAGVVTRRPLVLAIFTNEEGVRFQPDMMGSLAFVGDLSIEQVLTAVAPDGKVLGEELARIGYAGSMRCGKLRPHAFVEVHIEQGPILHQAGELLGAVENLQGISWQEIIIRGISNHAGTTPLHLRHDAAYCASCVTVFVRELARRMGGSQVGTVGSVRLVPNLINVIAREACLTVDLRNTNDALLEAAEKELATSLQDIARVEGVQCDVRRLARTPSVQFDARIVELIENVASQLGHQGIRRMTSGAGHDAQMLARICPTAMIFVPSIDGISHNPREYTEPDHLVLGANVLLHVLARLAAA